MYNNNKEMKIIILLLAILNFNLILSSSSSSSFGSSSYDGSINSSSSFQSGNILLTDPTSLNPAQFYEFTTSGDSVYNYSSVLQHDQAVTCFPVDMGFLDDSTLLLLDGHQGIFESSHKGNVKGYWNNLKTNTKNKLGCSLSKLSVDLFNNLIYVASTNMNCDYNFVQGIYVYNFEGEMLFTIQNDKFNTTTGIAGDNNGNVWITDINEIFIFNIKSRQFKTIDPIGEDKIAYNGITISQDNEIYVSVPSYQNDMIIQLESDGSLVRSIKMIGYFDGTTSGLPGSLALTKNHIYVEVPYASKKEKPPGSSSSSSGSSSEQEEFEFNSNKEKVDIIQAYNLSDGSFDKSWGGHSCKPENILCIPYSGFVIIP